MTRRTCLGALAVSAAALKSAQAAHKTWRPRLGVLGPYTPANLEFAKQQGFKNLILDGASGSTLNARKMTDSELAGVKSAIAAAGLTASALQITVNHLDPDPARRADTNAYFARAIAMAGKLGIPYIGTASGKNPALPFKQQVSEIVEVYKRNYFDACAHNNVRILWEPWPEGPNLATSPVGFAALLEAFGDGAPVGLQYDPSHLVRQFMDPIQTARDFVGKIYDIHLKDTEILWPMLHAAGINPVDGSTRWWRYRIPGMGSINWREFFNVFEDVGYEGGMSIEQEDPLYGGEDNHGPDFSPDFQLGFIMAKRYLNQYVP